MKPWDARQRRRGLWGVFYRWLYSERRREAIRQELTKRRRQSS